LALVSYTRGNDLSGTLQGAGGIGGLLARTDNGQMIAGSSLAHAYYHADGNGNITALVSTNGVLVARYNYDPYGNLLGMSGPLAEANTYRFSSKEYAANAGLYYYGFRFYEPNLQRWLSRDPIGEKGGMNLFAYALCNPVGYLDPLGLVRWGCAFDALAGAIGNGFGVAGGVLLGAGTSWSGVGAVAGIVIAGKSLYGVGANLLNLYDAVTDQSAHSNGSLINDILPNDPDWQRFGTALDLAVDLGGSRIAKTATTVSKAGRYGGELLEGGAKLGPNFAGKADTAIETLAGVQIGQTALREAGAGGGCK